jgi:hypothetical protein
VTYSWFRCSACSRVHIRGSVCLTADERARARSFPCFWLYGSVPYLVPEAASPETLEQAESEMQRRARDYESD